MQQSDDNYWDKYINSFNMNYIPKKEKAVSQREDDELKGAIKRGLARRKQQTASK